MRDLGIRFDLDRQVRPVTPALTRCPAAVLDELGSCAA